MEELVIKQDRQGRVLVACLDNPPVNALGAGLRRQLMAVVGDFRRDESASALVITATGRMFSAGADIREFAKPPTLPATSLPALIEAIEDCDKPVIAAINGDALGGGLELVLGCHHRVAVSSARLGLPEVKLGILPGAGGTQRLPRLVGVGAALEMIISGEPVTAGRALELGLVDRVVEGDQLLSEAVRLAEATTAVRRTRELPVLGTVADIDVVAKRLGRRIEGLHAPGACIEAMRIAISGTFDEGLTRERELFRGLVNGPQSRALRHAFFAERQAAKVDGLPGDVETRSIRRVGVIGAGTMGGGISMNFLSAGIPVTLVEAEREALERGVGIMRRNYEASAAKGRLTGQQVEQALSLLSPSLDFAALGDCDLVIEAVYESMDLKKEVFARLDRVAKPGAILASNTSYLDINKIAAITSRPSDVLGLHFFSPANVMKLVEVVRGRETSAEVLATAMGLARRIGKVGVVAGVCYGFIGNRMLRVRQEQSRQLLLEGVTPQRIDALHRRFGMPMGPFEMQDLAGVDVGWHRDPERIETLRDAICAAGRWGQKTGGGYYDYGDDRKPRPSPETERIIAEFRARSGCVDREVTDEEIIARTLYAMVNEGAHILEGGFAQRASDIDVVWLYGYGWPRHTGGPMFWATEVGYEAIVKLLERHASRLGSGFEIAGLLRQPAAAT